MANDKAFKIKNGLSAKRYLQSSTAVAASDVDMSLGSYFTKTLSANTTFTFSNPPASGNAGSFALEVTGANVTVGYDLANASYDSKIADTSFYTNEISGIYIKPDGTKMYISDIDTDKVYQYSLTTAWDASTASYDSKSFSTLSQHGYMQGIYFKSDGTKMYAYGGNNTIYVYTLSTAWDVSTASYDNFSHNAVVDVNISGRDIFFKPDGTKMYTLGIGNYDVLSYSLSTAWDITDSSRTFDGTSACLDITSTVDTAPTGLYISDDGYSLFIVGSTGDAVYKISLSTAWDVSTGDTSSEESFSVSSQMTFPNGMTIGDNGTKMYVLNSASGGSEGAYQYSIVASSPATITYPSSVKWSGATTPDAPAAGEKDVYVFVTTDGGTTYYAKQAGDAVA